MWSNGSPRFTGIEMKFVVPPSGGFFKRRLKAELRTRELRTRRIRRAGLTGVATLIARGVTVGLGLITLPLTSHYLGKERFGLWLALNSFIAWVSIADLGLSGSLINALSTAGGREDRDAARASASSVFWMMALVAFVAIALCLLVVPFIPWAAVFNVESPEAAAEIAPAVITLLIFCALRLPASASGSVWQAFQEGYVYQIWTGAGGLFAAFGLWTAIRFEAGLPWLCAAFLGGMLMADLASSVYLFGWRRRWMMPRLRDFDRTRARLLLRLGGSQRGVAVNIIVADSGSTDATPEICRRWNARVIYAEPGNMYRAINAALNECTASGSLI
ncbi:MAG: oligosaccharide flippase family protein [Blastocatellia bacterium]